MMWLPVWWLSMYPTFPNALTATKPEITGRCGIQSAFPSVISTTSSVIGGGIGSPFFRRLSM